MIIEPKDPRLHLHHCPSRPAAPPMSSARSTMSWSRARSRPGRAACSCSAAPRATGLASRIVTTFGSDADTVGVSFEKRASGSQDRFSAGWYNNRAFEHRAKAAGRVAVTVEGDAFSDAVKAEAIAGDQAPISARSIMIVY
jgi:trans-2-enoyl-CoA reductase